MKRTHIHVGVSDLTAAITRYSALFGAAPVLVKDDYAKWLLDDPQLNFAITTRDGKPGEVSHLGIQLDSEEELDALAAGLRDVDAPLSADRDAHCCYAKSDKEWTVDADGIAWELFVTHEQDESFGEDRAPHAAGPKNGETAKVCCS